MVSKKVFSVLGSILILVLFLTAQGKEAPLVSVLGRVYDPASMSTLQGVEVAWKDRKVRSDETGRYEIHVPAGVRELSFSASGRPATQKLLVIRQSGPPITLDVLLANSSNRPNKVLALERGSLITSDGKDLESDVAAASTISLADDYGNQDQLLTLNTRGTRVHSPVWWNSGTILFGKEAVVHLKDDQRLLGVFRYDLATGKSEQIASQVGIYFLDKSPRGDAIVAASQKDLYVIDSPSSRPASLRRIHSLAPNRGFLLSVAWGGDDRIYFTVDESSDIDAQRSTSRSRIASIKSDGTELKPDWAADRQYSYRYALWEGKEGILFSRFTLDGKEQTVWKRMGAEAGGTRLFSNALRAIHSDPDSKRFYYIYQQDLHLRDLASGADLVIANSVREASYYH